MSPSSHLADNPTIARADSLVASEVSGEVVILSIESGFFFLLNKTGSRIWELLEAPLALDAITGALIQRFAVDPDDCRREASEFVQVMLDKGLFRRA